jgi:hypothetical protein
MYAQEYQNRPLFRRKRWERIPVRRASFAGKGGNGKQNGRLMVYEAAAMLPGRKPV